MRFAPAVAALVLVLVSYLPVRARPACAQPSLRLSEVLAGPAFDWDGSGAFSSRDDEWIELVNDAATPLDLTQYLITDGDSIPRIALSGTLAPGERRMVYGKESYDWERANGFPAFGLSLGNSGDEVIVWHVAGPDTVAIDSYTYKSHEAASDRSVARAADTGSWALFDGLNPYAGTTPPVGTGCAPTPGLPNTCNATPTRPVSWGEVKRIYR